MADEQDNLVLEELIFLRGKLDEHSQGFADICEIFDRIERRLGLTDGE